MHSIRICATNELKLGVISRSKPLQSQSQHREKETIHSISFRSVEPALRRENAWCTTTAIIENLCLSSRRGASKLQDEFCFLCLPPGFPAVPRYFVHTGLSRPPLSEPCLRYSRTRLLTLPFTRNLARYAMQFRCHRFSAAGRGRCFFTSLDHVLPPFLRRHYPPSSVLRDNPTPYAP